MTITRTIFNANLKRPDSIRVECGEYAKVFAYCDRSQIGAWIKGIWAQDEFFHSAAYVYYDIDWDCNHVLYCIYECTD